MPESTQKDGKPKERGDERHGFKSWERVTPTQLGATPA